MRCRLATVGVALTAPLVLPYPPGDNHLYAVVRGRKILSAEGRAFKARVAWLAKMARIKPLAGDVVAHVALYRPRKAGDLTRAFKVMFDALNGWAYGDDKQIVELHARRFEDPANPRVEVRVVVDVPTTKGET